MIPRWYLGRDFRCFAGIFSRRGERNWMVSGQIGRQNGPKPPSGWKKFTFLHLDHTFSPPRGVFSHTYFTPKSHVVKVEMLLFRLCAKDWIVCLRQGQGGFSAPTHNQ